MKNLKNILLIVLFSILLLGSTIAGISQVSLYATNGTSVVPVKIDQSTRAMTGIDYSHHEIHSGSHFHISYCDDDLDSAQNADLLIVTPDTTKWSHFTYRVTSTLDVYAFLAEDATTSNDGTGLTEWNSNRNSGTAATATVTHTPTVTGTGNAIWQSYFGLSTGAFVREGGESRNDEEFILKRNAKYLLRVTSGTNDNQVCIHINWYEHTDLP